MYEIDESIKLLEPIKKNKVIYCDFMKVLINKRYKTIIGNPPYVRTTKGNLYIDFTEKCYDLLEDDGELIFIVPSDFLKLTSATTLLNKMMENGSFTHIFHPNDEKMFENASIDVIIFRYCKNNFIKKKYYIMINCIIYQIVMV
jgi:adenine-specific DNA-methyltransferase